MWVVRECEGCPICLREVFGELCSRSKRFPRETGTAVLEDCLASLVGCVESSERTMIVAALSKPVRSEDSTHPTATAGLPREHRRIWISALGILLASLNKRKRPGSFSNEPGRPEHRVVCHSFSQRRGRIFCSIQKLRRPLTLALSPQDRGEGTRGCFAHSTATVTRAAVVAQVAVAVSHGDGSAGGTGGGVGLEAGELLVAVRGGFQTVAA